MNRLNHLFASTVPHIDCGFERNPTGDGGGGGGYSTAEYESVPVV